jgi:hypothetical protein
MFLLACSGANVDIGPGNGSDSGNVVDPPSNDGGVVNPFDAASIPGPKVTIHVETSTAPFAHNDGFSGQTTRMTKQGVRLFRLLRTANDPQPVVVFDHGNGFVEAGYDNGDDTVIGIAPVSKLLPGTYTIAQMVVTHSRFHVYSTMHWGGGSYPGDFDCIQALSDNTTLGGSARSRGWYRYIFTSNGQSTPQEGTNAPLPTQAETGGFTLKTNGGESYYELPVNLIVPSGVTSDVTVVLDVNMNDAFRWEDQALLGYTKGVYDTTPLSYEPVRRYGANSYKVSIVL